MHEISKFGVTFKRLDLEHLEMVRQWRNSDDVRLYMQYQKIISPEEQLDWFYKINNDKNFYFIAYKDKEPFGVYNIKDIDYTIGYGELGGYLKNKNFWEGGHDVKCSFLLIDFVFCHLKLNYVVCEILKTNIKVISLNKQFGYKVHEEKQNSYILKLLYEDYLKSKAHKIKSYIK
jgi:UDP-4-amino-4,6-dideoxy-N-acetyl-beta-L-altrosamine N-acetyltransferase